MADVFLSYAHADRKPAERLAAALTDAGLEVWLDRDIHGGAEFARTIEREIAAARHVVVIWSRDSQESRWVRDEAQLALDAGKLVPVSIDGTLPPLGFRQIQAVSLEEWAKGRDHLPVPLLAALSLDPPAGRERAANHKRAIYLVAGGLALLLAAVAAFHWWPQGDGGMEGQTLVIAPLQVNARDDPAALLDQTLSNDLTRLVLGHDAQLNFVDSGSGAASKPGDFLLTGDARSSGQTLHASVRLTRAEDGIILWSSEFDGPKADVPALRQRISVRVADVLLCALGSRSRRPDDIDLPTLRLFLSGCENMHPAVEADWHVARDIFAQVVSRRPDFAQARALHALSLALTVGDFSPLPRDQWEKVREEARNEARAALAQDPSLGAAYVAIVNTYGYGLATLGEKLKTIEEGLKADPDVADLYNSQAVIYAGIGVPAASLGASEKAVRLDPFAPLIASNLIEAYAYAGRMDEAEKLLAQSQANWPGSFYIDWMRFKVPARFGDPRKALELLAPDALTYKPARPDLWRLFLEARIRQDAASRAAFARAARETGAQLQGNGLSDTIESLVQLSLVDDAYALALGGELLDASWNFFWFDGAMKPFRNDPRFLEVMERQGLMKFWRKNRIVPEFCTKEALSYACNLS